MESSGSQKAHIAEQSANIHGVNSITYQKHIYNFGLLGENKELENNEITVITTFCTAVYHTRLCACGSRRIQVRSNTTGGELETPEPVISAHTD